MHIVLPSTSRALDIAQTVHRTAVTGMLHLVNARTPQGGPEPRRLTAAPQAQTAGHRAPVVLVHGFGGNASTWSPLERWLSAAGFAVSHATTYSPFARCVTDVARALVADCHDAMERAGSDQVHLIGYSLGGVVVRYAVQELGLEPHVRTAVTVAAPHRGTLAAQLGRGTVAAAVTPGSGILADLRRGARASSVRWVSYYSDRDLVVRPRSSRLDERALGATNVPIPGVGHLGIIRSPLFLTSVVHLLRQSGHPEPTSSGVAA